MTDDQSPPIESASPRPGVTTPWAIASLLCGIAFCPPVSAFGILLGARALIQIKANPSLRGRNLALAGIALAILSQISLVCGLVWWHFNARMPMMQGPREQMQAGMSGSVAAFKAGFTGPGAAASDDEAQRLLHEIESRYGRLLDSQVSQASTTKASMAGAAELTIPYTFTFARKSVEAEAVFMTFAPTRLIPKPVFKWVSLRIIDPEQGDLVYPAP
jgi:hypothetical protein